MWHQLIALSSCILAACLGDASVMSAGLDFGFDMDAHSGWTSGNEELPILLRPASPPSIRLYLSQAKTGSNSAITTPPAIPKVALLAEMEKRWVDAEHIYRDLLAKEPNRVDLLLRLADVLAVEGKFAEVAQTLAQAADLRPDDADLQLHASQEFGASGRLADAIRYNERAIAIRPTDPALQRRRAELYAWAGNYAEAEKILRTLIDANPADMTLERDLARVLGGQGQLDEAIKLLSDYVAQHPDDKNAFHDLERFETARRKHAVAVPLNPARRLLRLA